MLRHALRDRVADVVQLHVDEHLLAGVGERAREIEPAGEAELIADLVEHDRLAEPRHHRLRLGDGGNVERNDQAFAGIEHLIDPLSHTSRAYSTSLRTTSLSCVAARAVGKLVILVERLFGVRDRDLLRHHQRAAADRQHLPQREQRLHRPGAPGRGAAERKGAVLEHGQLRLAGFAHGRDPVDGVLQQRRDRGVVFGACDEDAAMRADELLEPQRVEGRSRLAPRCRRRRSAADSRRARCG